MESKENLDNIIQITACGNSGHSYVIALCSDGSVWEKGTGDKMWDCINKPKKKVK